MLLCPRSERRLGEAALQWVGGQHGSHPNWFFSLQVARMTDPRSWWSVPTSVVARAMLKTSLQDGEVGILEHKDIVTIGKE